MDPLTKDWHDLHAKNLEKRQKTNKERLRKRKLGLATLQNKSSMRVHIKVPENLNLFENYEETITFINEINETIFEKDLFVYLDFSTCKAISSETCVVLAAEIDRCKRKVSQSVLGSYPANAQVYFFLNEIGFFQLLGVRSSKPIFDSSSEVSALRLVSGIAHTEKLMRGVKELFFNEEILDENLENENSINPQAMYTRKVYRALTEAMGNAVEHAYPKDFQEKNSKICLPIWWRAIFRFHETNDVLMILYDQGAGIPNTLELHWQEKLIELVTRLSRQPNDDEKLEMAMEKGRSRTNIPGRGQGSYDMQSLIRESSNSILSIFSYKGTYSYRSDDSWDRSPLVTPLKGTLIVWKVCLNVEECAVQ